MLTYRPAAPEQYDEFFQLMATESRDYLDTTLQLMDADWDMFAQQFRTVGQVCGIYSEDGWAGFYWIEVRDAVLHIHGLILRPEFQGTGIGRQVLADLEAQYQDRVEAIELGVHRSNQRALALYQKTGFETVKTLEELGFLVLQKKLIGSASQPVEASDEQVRSGSGRGL
jgi:ribosomal protein S18 acetylase RimI-like enzyme